MAPQILLVADTAASDTPINIGQLYWNYYDPKYQYITKKAAQSAQAAKILQFVTEQTPKSIELEDEFSQIKEKEWGDPLVVINEINVQLGQLYSIVGPQEQIVNDERKFDSIEDELSDILLNLLNLARLENIEFTNLEKYTHYDTKNLLLLVQLLGQLSEAVMENSGYRFKKARVGFETRKDFIKDRIVKMFIIIFNYATENNINLFYEFDKMYDDAMDFVCKKVKEQKGWNY